ncbi:MAG: hypothetical protein CK425_10420 [Parachlamydia sp.]|nr:MAG: hypothetical protein CK425_10420 [Parachlamydia sp.]
MFRLYLFGIIIMFSQLNAALSSPRSLTYIKNEREFSEIPAIATEAYGYLKNTPLSPSVTRFIFIRHGESTSNQERTIAGRKLDVGLSEEGIQQAELVGRSLKNIQIAHFYSSPSLRAQQTVACIEENLCAKAPAALDERLYEKFYGPYEGASEQEYAPVKQAEEVENSGLEKTFEEKFAFKYHPEMESMTDVLARVTQFVREKSVPHQGQNVLIGTHNGVLKALFMADAASKGYDIDYRAFILGNCALLVVEVEGSEVRVMASNKLKFK